MTNQGFFLMYNLTKNKLEIAYFIDNCDMAVTTPL